MTNSTWLTDEQIIHKFATLFSGRLDAVGGDEGRAIYEPYNETAVEAHLMGLNPIGVYPTWPDSAGLRWTRWGCCDIDTGDWSEAYMLARALEGMGLRPHVERSRSKGWHIWVFVETPVQAFQMRRCLKVAYAAIDLPAKEANPKSETLAPNQLGNYVRLPYPGGLIVPKERQCMMIGWTHQRDGEPLPLSGWVQGATWWATSPSRPYSDHELVIKWASKWFEKPRRTTRSQANTPEAAIKLAARLDKSWADIYQTGEVRDRSAAFVALAHWCAKQQWKADDTFTLLWWCPWNKYLDRVNGEDYVRDIVDRAYS